MADAAAAIMAEKPFSAEAATALEALVDLQAGGEAAYDFDANRHLLKAYSFGAAQAAPDTVARVLALALMRLPRTDMLACTYLVPVRMHGEAPVRAVLSLAEMLESAQYARFWRECEDDDAARGVISGVSGFLDAVRDFVAVTIEKTYTAVPRDAAAALLSLPADGDELGAFAAGRGWKADADAGTFVTPVGEETATGEKTEKVTLDQVAKVLNVLMA